MLFKLLTIAIVIYLVYIVFFKKKITSSNSTNNSDIIDDMIECPTCKTFISKDEAILSNGKYYCSKECLR